MAKRSTTELAFSAIRIEGGFQDCHIKPDLVLIYQKPDDERLVLARFGSHSEL